MAGRARHHARRRRTDHRRGRSDLRGAQRCRRRNIVRRPRRAGRGQARLDGYDRPAMAADRRPARDRCRHGRVKAPFNRRARGAQYRKRPRETDLMILNRAERMLARRYLLPGPGEGFIFLVASISLLAVALGVAALIIVMSVMNGFRAELFDKIVGLNGHAIVQRYDGRLADWQRIADTAKKTPGVTSALTLIEQPLMATANGRFEGAMVRGMRVEDLRSNTTINSHIVAGDMRSVVPGTNRVAIGSRLAQTLGLYPGGQITLWNPEGRSTVVGTVPREVTYTVGAIFEIGVFDYDKAFVIMPMQDAQSLLLMGDQVGVVEIQTSDPDRVQQILAPLKNLAQGRGVIV